MHEPESESAPRPAGGDEGWSPAEEAAPHRTSAVPGFSPQGVVPLPPQQTRVPGASLAAVPPADFHSPADQRPPGNWSLADRVEAEAARQDTGYDDSEPGYRAAETGATETGATETGPPGTGAPETGTANRPDPEHPYGPSRSGYDARSSSGQDHGYPVGIAAAFPARKAPAPEHGGGTDRGEAAAYATPSAPGDDPTRYGPDGDQAGQPSAAAPGSPAAPLVPRQRSGSEPAVAGRVVMPRSEQPFATTGDDHAGQPDEPDVPTPRAVSASASVPLASRLMPPTDHTVLPVAVPAPRPRVYGRPVDAEVAAEPVEPQQERAEPQPDGAQAGSPAVAARVALPAPEPARQSPAPGPAPFGDLFDQPGERPGQGPRESQFGSRPENPYGAPPENPYGPGPENPYGPGPDGLAGGDRADNPGGPGVPTGSGPADRTGLMSSLAGSPQPAPEAPAIPNQYGGPGQQYGSGPGQQYGTPRVYGGVQQPAGTAAGPGGWAGQPEPEPEPGRFDAFKPEASDQPKAEPPTPHVRNGRVLVAVLTAAALMLVIPLGGLWLIGRMGNGDPPPFVPSVGDCVRNEAERPVPADCGAEGAFQVVSKVEQLEQCPAPQQAYVVIPATDNNPRQVLCLQPAAAG